MYLQGYKFSTVNLDDNYMSKGIVTLQSVQGSEGHYLTVSGKLKLVVRVAHKRGRLCYM